ncbi:Uncharacterised protein [Fusobacterium varium]|nr:Uncharacterised protein [Fusobacterium varium]
MESPPKSASIETRQAANPAEVALKPKSIPAIGFLFNCLYKIPAIGTIRTYPISPANDELTPKKAMKKETYFPFIFS